MESYFFHFLTLFGTGKKCSISTHFWNEPQNVIRTTGWESRSKSEGKGKICGLENALQAQVSMLLALLTWVCVQGAFWCAVVLISRTHSRFELRKSQISQRKVSGPAFVKLGLKLNITWGMNLLWFSLDQHIREPIWKHLPQVLEWQCRSNSAQRGSAEPGLTSKGFPRRASFPIPSHYKNVSTASWKSNEQLASGIKSNTKSHTCSTV